MPDFHLRVEKSCSCKKCQDMCRRCPCLGTPADIEKIIAAGHGSKLALTLWQDEKNNGTPLPIIAPRKTARGCIFLNKHDLCDLHAAGLKPTEGRLALHDQPDNGLHRFVGYTWISEEGIRVFQSFHADGMPQIVQVVREIMPFVKQGRHLQIEIRQR